MPRSLSLTLLLLATACAGEPAGPPAGPRVTLVDSVVVSDPDTFPRREGAGTIARSARGDLLVGVQDRVLHFRPDGQFVRVLGVPGEGPGELRDIGGVGVLPGDSVVLVVSVARGRMIRFRLADGAVLGEVVAEKAFGAGQQWAARGDTLYLPVSNGEGGYRRWVLGTDTAALWGEEPPSANVGAGRAYMAGGEPSAEPFGDGLVAFVPADSMLLVYDTMGTVTRRVLLPVRVRRPFPADAEDQIQEGIRQTPPVFRLPGPAVIGMHRLPDGRYLMVHIDFQSVTLENPLRLGVSNVHYWISMVSADLREACVDGEIPDPPEAVVRPLFYGDTIGLFVRSTDDDGTPHSVLREYRVSGEGCGWVPMPGEG